MYTDSATDSCLKLLLAYVALRSPLFMQLLINVHAARYDCSMRRLMNASAARGGYIGSSWGIVPRLSVYVL